MRDRLIEIFRNTNYQNRPDGLTANLATQFSEYALREIVDALLANGVIVPPCKLGEVLYVAVGAIPEYEVLSFSIREQGLLIQTHSKFTGGLHPIWACRIGKDVFLTREQAEEALAEVANAQH